MLIQNRKQGFYFILTVSIAHTKSLYPKLWALLDFYVVKVLLLERQIFSPAHYYMLTGSFPFASISFLRFFSIRLIIGSVYSNAAYFHTVSGISLRS